jgi:hypothetical protein
MSRAQQTSTVEQNTGGAVAPFVAGKNKIINGDFGVWQRGTTLTNPLVNAYLADRWYSYAPTTTITQETSVVPTNFRYSIKLAATASTTPYINQIVETANALQFAGQTVTLSAYISASTATSMAYSIGYSTSVDNPNTGTWTYLTGINVTAGTSGSFLRQSATFSIPSTAKTLIITINPAANIANGVNLYITGVQLESGSVATPFTTASGTVQGELALCQRYCFVQNPSDGYSPIGNGHFYTTTSIWVGVVMPVQMRTTPSLTSVNLTSLYIWSAGNARVVSTIGIDHATPTLVNLSVAQSIANTAGYGGWVAGNNTTNWQLIYSAEL